MRELDGDGARQEVVFVFVLFERWFSLCRFSVFLASDYCKHMAFVFASYPNQAFDVRLVKSRLSKRVFL